uniref:Calcium-regulated actin-bundling protein C-terminal domain-containing protein n=1 Tax=Aplanochytrium stocchinoi TaxID=215587 RepID=A0A7S3PIE7_9STRA|mmetsp:Transcript_17767/g.21887  ORF Transcript_17767/g.21887 Transcript_17767/m.21887 type:complete len:394 (+) Transcript_17767:171-1352(+)
MSTDEEWDTSVNETTGDKFNTKTFVKEVATTAPEPLIPPVTSATMDEAVQEASAASEQVQEIAEKTEQVKIEESVPKAAPVAVAAPAAAPTGASSENPSERKHLLRPKHTDGTEKAFTEALDEESLAFFNELTQKKFSEQAVAFLNAYWEEVGDQADFIFECAWEVMKYADMHTKGINYIHLYEEGNDLDFNIGLYFYEKLCKKVLESNEGKKWREDPKYKISMPTMQTAIVRKKELREKVDVNFDGRVSFLEYLLYQYQDLANPADFTHRSMKYDQTEHPEITKAKNALEKVNHAIAEYESEKKRLEELAAKPGVKGIGAKHQLAILHASPLAEELNKSLITAEAAVRMVMRKFKGQAGSANAQAAGVKPTQGSLWWINRDLQEKKKLYGKR